MNRRTQGPTGHGSPPTPSSDCARRRPGSHWRLHYDNSTPRLSVSLVPCNDRLAVFCAAKATYYRSGAQGPSMRMPQPSCSAPGSAKRPMRADGGAVRDRQEATVESSSTHDARHRERARSAVIGSHRACAGRARPPSRSQAGVSPCVHSCLPAGRMAEGRGTPRRKARHAIGAAPQSDHVRTCHPCATRSPGRHSPRTFSRKPFLKRRGKSFS